MKRPHLYLIPGLLICQLVAQTEFGKLAIAAESQKAATGDIRGLTDSLPDLEGLWKEHPVAYLEAIKISIPTLNRSGNPDAKNAALAAFPNLIAKTCPKDTAAAAAYIAAKSTALSSYFGFQEISGDKDRLLMIADFLAEGHLCESPTIKIREPICPEGKS